MMSESILENQPVTLKFPIPSSSIAAFPMGEQWPGQLKVIDSDVFAVFTPPGIDGDLNFALNHQNVSCLIRCFKLKQNLVLHTNSSPEELRTRITPVISCHDDFDANN